LPFEDEAFECVLCPQATLGLLGEAKRASIREAARIARWVQSVKTSADLPAVRATQAGDLRLLTEPSA